MAIITCSLCPQLDPWTPRLHCGQYEWPFPLAAIVGTSEIMAHFDVEKVGQEKFTFQIGTLSGNPVAAAAGLKTLEIL